ncbi:MAG: class II aldolase/adducin family protein [Rhodospirillaceae bacterium]|nr:class II aldolase/adducin family protein [Rhodospirillaceae bacterium]
MNEIKKTRMSVRDQVSAEEWQTRVDTAAAYRLIHRYGMSDLIYTHISARVPGPEEHFLLNPYGLLFDEITASRLIKIDLSGKTILNPNDDLGLDINPAGYVIHSAVHEARPEVGCVIHTHTRAGMAVSAMKCGLLPLTQVSMRFHGRVGYHDYEGPALDLDEQKRLVADLGTERHMILRNHGLLVACPTVAEAFNAMYWLENACKVQVDVMACNTEINYPPAGIPEKVSHSYLPETRRPYGLLEWPTMLRLLDRTDPSYRD